MAGQGGKLDQQGFTLIELLIVVGILAILVAIALPAVSKYRRSGQIAAIQAECRTLYTEIEIYYQLNGEYPETIDLTNFSPVSFKGEMLTYTVDNKIDSYGSPDDEGVNQEFWLQLTLISDPSVQFVVSRSDNVPLEPGIMLNGTFRFNNGVRQM